MEIKSKKIGKKEYHSDDGLIPILIGSIILGVTIIIMIVLAVGTIRDAGTADGTEWLIFIYIFIVLPIGIFFSIIGIVVLLIGIAINVRSRIAIDSYMNEFSVTESSKVSGAANSQDSTNTAANDDKRQKVICPNCGREQTKNPFGCIYCHHEL